MMYIVVGSFILICCLLSLIKLFSGGHKTLGKVWILLYLGSLALALQYRFAAAIPLCIFCLIAFFIPKK